jgi:hypothetical protein
MPSLDITELLGDPDLADEFLVLRRSQGNNADGVNTIEVVGTILARGYVGPADSNDLQRLPDYQAMSKTLNVITQTRLIGPSNVGSASTAPDIIIWPANNGDRFVVADLQDFSRFGAGFVDALCVSQSHLDKPTFREGQG